MNKQKLLDNFLTIVNSKGRAVNDDGLCLYFPKDDHPGCAIGCQPGFRERFKDNPDIKGGIYGVIVSSKEVCIFLEVEVVEDKNFLSDLQGLHDDAFNWNNLNLKPEAITAFKTSWELN